MGCFRRLGSFLVSVVAMAQPTLTKADVQQLVEAAAKSIDSSSMAVAMTDRQGDILAVFRKCSAAPTVARNFGKDVDANELAVGLARTAGFFSNAQAPISSRTVRFISGVHFPPGVFLHRKRGALRHREHQPRLHHWGGLRRG